MMDDLLDLSSNVVDVFLVLGSGSGVLSFI